MKAGLLTAALLIVIAPDAPAARAGSFECSQAAATAEKVICGDDELAELDRRLADYYAGAQVHFAESGECLSRDQEQWLRSTRDQCSDASCLKAVYLDRLAVLDAAQPAVSAIKDMKLPQQPSLAVIVPPNDDADNIPPESSTPVELTGRYALSDDYGLTLTDAESRLFVLAGLLNQEVPIELAALEQENAAVRVRGRLLNRAPATEDYPGVSPPDGVFDPHDCIYVYRDERGDAGRQ